MRSENGKILLCLCHMSGKEIDFINKAFEKKWVVPLGPNVDGFEKDLEEFLGDDVHVVALSSGTAAIHLGLIVAGVKAGDEVIVQSFTFSASANPVEYIGAIPVFVDSESDTWNMDPELLDKAIADRLAKTGRLPRAIVPVHLYGMPANMEAINSIAAKWNIPVVEDAAEALGSSFKNQRCGTFGIVGALSFNGNKMITTSGGGALVCHSAEAAERTKFLATQARDRYPFYEHSHIGFNYRMSNICAGIGRGQMTILNQHINHHRRLHEIYAEEFEGSEAVRLHTNPGPAYDSNYWLCNIILDESVHVRGYENAYPDDMPQGIIKPDSDVEALRLTLDKAAIESRPLWKPMHLQPVFADAPAYVNGTSEKLFRRGLCIPAGPWVTEEDARFVAKTIKDAILP